MLPHFGQSGPGKMAMKEYSTFPKAPALKPHHQIVSSYPKHALEESYPSADMQSEYSAAQAGWATGMVISFSSHCIYQVNAIEHYSY